MKWDFIKVSKKTHFTKNFQIFDDRKEDNFRDQTHLKP